MKAPIVFMAITAACFALSCASEHHEADRGVEGTLRSTIPDRHVHVDVDRGVVTLEGKVNTEADRQRIEMLARGTAGVVAVKNKLHVTLPTPGDYGAIPSSTTLQTAPPTAVVTEPPAIVAAPPAVVAGPPAVIAVPDPTLPAVVVPNTPRVEVQPATPNDQITAKRIVDQLGHDPVATTELEHVKITVNNGTAAIQGVVESESKRDALIASVQRAGGIATIYDQLKVQ